MALNLGSKVSTTTIHKDFSMKGLWSMRHPILRTTLRPIFAAVVLFLFFLILFSIKYRCRLSLYNNLTYTYQEKV